MSSPITGCSFTLTHLHSQAYELDVTFATNDAPEASKKQFTFIQQSPAYIPEIVDIYSQNGTCLKTISQLFTKKDEKGIEQAAQKWSEENPCTPSLLVLDLKDESQSYKNKALIQEKELAFSDFLQEDSLHLTRRAQKIHQIFEQKLPLDFILCEGALKCDLLHQFSDAQADYFLHSRKGRLDFCQYAEPYMTAFKLGQTVKGFTAQDYFLAPSHKSFKPAEISTVWYPAAYEEIYSIESPFFDVMRSIFSLTGSKDPLTHISTISVKRFP